MANISSKLNMNYDRVKFQSRASARREWTLLIGALALVDAACVAFSLNLAYQIRIAGLLFGWAYENVIDPANYAVVVLLSVPIWLAWAALMGLYKRDNLLGGVIEYKQVLKTCSAGIFTIILFTFLLRESAFELSRWWIVLAWMLSTLCMMVARFVMRRVAYGLRRNGYLLSRVLIVGANDQGVAIARQWMESPRSGMHVVGFLDDFKAIGSKVIGELGVVGRPTALVAQAHEHQADEVVVVSSAVAWETFGELVTMKHSKRNYALRLSPGFYEMLTSGMAVTNKTFVPLLTLHESRIVGVEAMIKTVFDYTVALAVVVPTLPGALLLALLLRRKRPGQPVLTRQPSLGLGGRPFDMLLFNTRDAVATHRLGVTRNTIESWLVWTGIDKWPQLLNVLRGEMAVVGPRPLPEGASISETQGAHNLLSVKPGVLGPWIIHDVQSSPDLLHDEVTYVRNWEIWRDIPILMHAVHQHLQRLTSFSPARPSNVAAPAKPRPSVSPVDAVTAIRSEDIRV